MDAASARAIVAQLNLDDVVSAVAAHAPPLPPDAVAVLVAIRRGQEPTGAAA